ncbi:MAG TPA: S-adenosylmethionine:tRNA ribosyltransferase-isomerase, partial [Spirochaetota bacterium]|nr:S-adenosylmethionine:tRNA ribosyltransferase-isomerase [Spirochaetota bacterium]
MKKKIYTLSDFDYFLPEELIAQYPAEHRGMSRLLIVNR